MLRLGIVGAGRWGIHHVRTAYELGSDNLVMVCDPRESVVDRVSEVAPGVTVVRDLESLCACDEIDAVVVAVPAESHYAVTKQMLEAGKHCLVEKPLALSMNDAKEVVALARRLDRIVMVGHVLLYHPAVVEMKRRIEQGMIGDMQYIYSNRLNLGSIRSEENILWSFAPHDIAILQYLVGDSPLSVDAKGATFLQDSIEDTTITHLLYPRNIHAHIFVSWLHPFKEQRLVVIGQKGMLVFEDSVPEKKLRYYPKGFDTVQGELKKFEGDFLSVPFASEEPLVAEHRHFYECVMNGQTPLTDGTHALEVLDILQQAQRKLKQGATTRS